MSDIPRLSAQFQQPREQDQIEWLLQQPDVDRVAIYGLPGVGKTAVAAKIAARVLDGEVPPLKKVLWASLGQAPDPVSLLRDWCQELGVTVPPMSGDQQDQASRLRNLIRPALAGRRTLIVLDDVGASRAGLEAAEECYVEGTGCRYLATTISPQAAADFAETEMRTVHVAQLDDGHAATMLERYADGRLSLAALDVDTRNRLLHFGGGLPLSLMVLGRLIGEMVRGGHGLQSILARLNRAEESLGAEVMPVGKKRVSIDTILTARWEVLPAGAREAARAAAVFREKPHAFTEAAWAGVFAAWKAGDPDVAEEVGWEAGKRHASCGAGDSAEGLALADEPGDDEPGDDEPGDDEPGDDEPVDDGRLAAAAAIGQVPGIREQLMRTGLLEQQLPLEPDFTLHYLVATFLRSSKVSGLGHDELKTLHTCAARYYRGWLSGFQDDDPASSPFQGAFRFENRRWLDATADLCYHLREVGDEQQAVLQLTTLFLDAFWWWGWYVRYPFCDELVRLWSMAQLGDEAADALNQLRRFITAYPVIDLGQAPPDDPELLPDDFDKTGRGDFQAAEEALAALRARLLVGQGSDSESSRADELRLRMLTAIFMAQSNRFLGRYDIAAGHYEQALGLLGELGEDDEWSVPYVRYEVAELQIARGDVDGALASCREAAAEATGGGEQLGKRIDHEDTDHEVISAIWRVAADAHRAAGRLDQAWRSHAWSCFHACAGQLWPKVKRAVAGELREEYGIDEYMVTFYKEQLARTLDRVGALWSGQQQRQACEGIRLIRATLRGGPDPAGPPAEGSLDDMAAVSPETPWDECRTIAWQDTALPVPLVPWGYLDHGQRAYQERVAADLERELKAVWDRAGWTLEKGPGGTG